MEDDSLPLSRQERTATIVFGTILAGFGLFWAIAASFVPTRNTYQAITPSFLPFWTGVILCGAGLLVVFATWKRQAVPDDPIQPLFIWSEQVHVAAFLAVLLAYCLLIETVHYFWLTLATMLVALVIARAASLSASACGSRGTSCSRSVTCTARDRSAFRAKSCRT